MRALTAAFIFVAFITVFSACSRGTTPPPHSVAPRVTPEEPSYWPTEGWRNSTPEQQGVDSESLLRAIDFIEKNDLNVHSLLVIRNGYIIADAYFYPFAANSKHDVASVTKSFTSTLVGIAIKKGYIKSPDQPLLSFFPDRTVARVNANKRAVTIGHLLTMSSGLKCRTWPGEITLFRMMQSPDWVQYMLDLPMKSKPGVKFKYSSGGVHLLSAIIHESTGKSEFEFAREELFGPLGITDVDWPADRQGINSHGWGDLKIKPHDMAKLGLLYLQNGQWDGEQLLPADWVETAASAHIPPDGFGLTDGYGYLWWVDSSGLYTADGRGGQLITLAPEKNMIIVFTAGLSGKQPAKEMDLIKSILVPGAKSTTPLPPNPVSLAKLEAAMSRLALPRPSASPVPRLPETAARISGKTFACEPGFFNFFNVFGLKTFSLTFEKENQALLLMSLESLEGKMDMELAVGLDGVYRLSPGRYGLPAAARGFWKTDNVLVIDLDEVGNINQLQITAKFKGEKVDLEINEGTGLPGGSYHGRIQ